MNSAELFDNLSAKIGNLTFGRTGGDKSGLSRILDGLNSLNYRNLVVQNPTKAVLLINQCCSVVNPLDKDLVPKCSDLISCLIKTQNVIVEGRTLTFSIQWCLKATTCTDSRAVLSSLKVLEALIKGNSLAIPSLVPVIIHDVSVHIEKETPNKTKISQEIFLIAIKCLEAITAIDREDAIPDNFYEYLENCAKTFLAFLCSASNGQPSVLEAKTLESCLAGLHNIVTVHPDYLKKELGLLLGIVKAYMMYGIQNISFLPPERLTPAVLSVPELNPVQEKSDKKLGRYKARKANVLTNRHKKKQQDGNARKNKNDLYLSEIGIGQLHFKTSDSDFSDTDAGQQDQLNHLCSKTRRTTLDLFVTIIKSTENPVIFTYWFSFIPENSPFATHNLCQCIYKEPTTRGKMCALNALLALLHVSRIYLGQAQYSDKPSSFTSFSGALGLTLLGLHHMLCNSIQRFWVPVLEQTLKCTSALILATPYHRMSPGLITKLTKVLRQVLLHRNVTVQVIALIAIENILAIDPTLPEIETALLLDYTASDSPSDLSSSEWEKQKITEPSKSTDVNHENFDYAQFSSDEECELDESQNDSMSWLLRQCLKKLGVHFGTHDNSQKDAVVPLKVESLNVISALSKNWFESLLFPHLSHITKALELTLINQSNDEISLHGSRTLELLGEAIDRMNGNNGITVCVTFWQIMLKDPLPYVYKSENEQLRKISCDCLASIGPRIFPYLPRNIQLVCITMLLSSMKDEAASVRAAAARALGIYTQFPSLKEDLGFIVDTSNVILEALQDKEVRGKAAWALGNLSNVILAYRQSSGRLEDPFPESILLKLCQECVAKPGAKDPMILSSLMRAMGYFVQLVDEELLENVKIKTECHRMLSDLIECNRRDKNMKAVWNACYSLGNALQNTILYDKFDDNFWPSSAFVTLSETLIKFKNLKVRINAAVALACVPSRSYYGQYYILIWRSALTAMENVQNIDDFSEYKHRDQLIDQICICLSHLTTVLSASDLGSLESVINPHLEMFRTNLRKVAERLTPEKSTKLISAMSTLRQLETFNSIGSAEKQTIQNLISIYDIDE